MGCGIQSGRRFDALPGGAFGYGSHDAERRRYADKNHSGHRREQRFLFLVVEGGDDLVVTNKTNIPEHEIEKIARCLLPDIPAFYCSKEGQEEFEKWKAMQRAKADTYPK